MKVMLLAAGRGERLRPLTDEHPKPLLEVGGKPLIVWHLERLAAAGFRDVVVNLSWLGEQIPAALGDGSCWGLRLHYSREPWPALETGGGLLNALPLLGPEPFLLVNGDVYADVELADLRLPLGNLAQLVLVPNPAHHKVGDFCLDGDMITENIGEKLTYSGIGVIDPELLAGCAPGRFPLAPLLFKARDAGRLGGQKHNGYWLDVGSAERLAELDARLRLCDHLADGESQINA
jgi:MurNAc alpha-1-phosphate uridylyltransferase